MRCPTCVEEREPHKVWLDSSTVTVMMDDAFWDEDDLPHRHDPNVFTASYHCSNGHRFQERFRKPCQQGSCEFNEKLGVV